MLPLRPAFASIPASEPNMCRRERTEGGDEAGTQGEEDHEEGEEEEAEEYGGMECEKNEKLG